MKYATDSDEAITFNILGPLEVRHGDRLIRVTGKQRALLGILLLDANRLVHRDRIVDGMWDDPPRSSVANLQTYMTGLRRALGVPLNARLDTHGRSYLLSVERSRLDLLKFADAADEGRRCAAGGQLHDAERHLRRAISLWRGEPLEDVPFGQSVAARLAELAEQRCQVWMTWVDVRLSLGAAEDLIGELRAAVSAYPLREQIWERLILALYRASQRGEALVAYQQARSVLVEELGIEPGPGLRRLHAAILDDDSSLTRPLPLTPGTADAVEVDALGGDRVRPSELPRDIWGFAGRKREQAILDTSLPSGSAVPAIRPGLWILTGTAGAGKTALAIHWAHRTKAAFPDGQLYLDLYGFNPHRDPLDASAALSQLLQSLGVPAEQIPVELEQREKLYRSLSADKRMLVLLDDARDACQVRPLLPGGGGTVVLVTSRLRLSGLVARHGAERLPLGALTPQDARELLASALGPERLAAEEDAADELARLCGHLPLALRIAAANITADPAGTIAGGVARLDRGDRLAALSPDGEGEGMLEVAFGTSYRSLLPEHQRMFRLIGLIQAPTFGPPAMAALAGCPGSGAAGALEALGSAHLIESAGEVSYRMHDLLRQYAADLAERHESPDERREATTRYFTFYLRRAGLAGLTIRPRAFRWADGPHPWASPVDVDLADVDLADVDLADVGPADVGPVEADPATDSADADLADARGALAWLQDELENLTSIVAYCTRNDLLTFAWQIMDALRPFLSVGVYREEWLEFGRRGLCAAVRTGDRQAEAAMHMSLGVAHLLLGRFHTAEEHLEGALAASTDSDWPEGTAEAAVHLSSLHLRTGNVGKAIDLGHRAIELHREGGDPGCQAVAHAVLGYSHWVFGDLVRAERHQARAHALHLRARSEYGQAICLTELAATIHDQGDLDRAARHYAEAVRICARLGAPARQVQALSGLSRVRSELGDREEGLRLAGHAMTLVRQARDRRAQTSALDARARACYALGWADEGREHHDEALQAAERVGVAWDIAHVLVGMTDRRALRSARAGGEELVTLGRRALAISQRHGFRLLEGKAAEALARVTSDADAKAWCRAALGTYQEIGHAPGAARVRRLMNSVTANGR
ncbi:winged helix-turn-helix domain-containing protein [Spirillospora sp. NBC_00431]